MFEGCAQLETKRAQEGLLRSPRSSSWTDHTRWTSWAVLVNFDAKRFRLIAWHLARGWQVPALGGRLARSMGFSSDEFFANYEAEGEPFPWSIRNDALPDGVARSPVTGDASATGGARIQGKGGDRSGIQMSKCRTGALTRVLSEIVFVAGRPP